MLSRAGLRLWREPRLSLDTDYWTGADLRALLQGELEPFLNDESMAANPRDDSTPSVDMDGPAVALPAEAAQPLAMAVHELATNALKYGALSAPEGRVSIAWQLDGGPTGLLRLRWVEMGGPAVAGPPDRRGFGSQVLDGIVRNQLGGTVTLAWKASGLVCAIEVPLSRTQTGTTLGSTGER